MELGKYKAEPFEEGTFPPNYLYALQRLGSEEDESFGAAFVSLRAGERINSSVVGGMSTGGEGRDTGWSDFECLVQMRLTVVVN